MGEWRASERAVLANTGYRCSVFWFTDGRWHPPVTVFERYPTADGALQAARAEADRRNSLLDSSQDHG